MSPDPKWSLNDSSLLGVGGWDVKAVFHRVDLLEVGGRGRPLPLEAAGPVKTAVSPQPPASPSESKLRADAEKAVKDQYRAEYAKRRPEDQLTLARKLLGRASESLGDPPVRFVLLQEARELAAQAGDATLAMEALTLQAGAFAVEYGALAASALGTAAKAARTVESIEAVAEAYLVAAGRCAAQDDVEAASSLAGKAELLGKAGQNSSLILKIQGRRKELEEQKREYGRAKGALRTLAERPDDPAANLAAGRYRCFFKGDWVGGLPGLARGSDPVLRGLAERERAGGDPAGLGEAWMEASKKAPADLRDACRSRALHWFKEAWPKAPASAKAVLRDRLKALQLLPGAGKLPSNSKVPGWAWGPEAILLEDRYAHSGRYSMLLSGAEPGKAKGFNVWDQQARAGDQYVISGWFMTEGSNFSDNVAVNCFDEKGAIIPGGELSFPSDQPYWSWATKTVTCPPGTAKVNFGAILWTPGAKVWMDDLSFKKVGEGKELLRNPGLEDPR
jgi:hypothetical protein